MSAKNETYGGMRYDPRNQTGQDKPCVPEHRLFENVPPANPELKEALERLAKVDPWGAYVAQTKPATFDKNTPGSLKQLRWELYHLVDRFYAEIDLGVRDEIKMGIEELFKEHTNS